jgi:WD40 repeat protein
LAVAFNRDGTRLAAASDDRQARIWRVTNSTLDESSVISLGEHGDWVFDVSFSPNSAQILTASGDGQARLWSLIGETGRLERSFPTGEERLVRKAVFNPSGASIATASENAVRVWQLTGSQEPEVIRHSRQVTDVAFQPPRGEWILTSSVDGTARVSGLESESAPRILRNGTSVRSAAFDATGRFVATGSDDGSVRLWRIAPADLVNYLANATTACLSASDRVTFLQEEEGEARRAYESCEQRYDRVPDK